MKIQKQQNYISLKQGFVKALTLACLFSSSNVQADQPVHCLRESLFGVWDFYVSKDNNTVNLFDTSELCTHSVPNKVQLVNKAHEFKFNGHDLYKFNLMDNYKCEAIFCKDGKEGDCQKETIKGKWTSIYDQAFNIELENGMRFLTNFRYNIKENITPDPFKEAVAQGIAKFEEIESGDNDKFDSTCDQTMVGFVQPIGNADKSTMAEHKVTCFYGKQRKHYDIEETKAFNTGKVKYNKITARHQVKPDNLLADAQKDAQNQGNVHAAQVPFKRTKAKRRANMHLEHKPSDEMDLMISAINEAELGWTADVCKYQKTHALYGDHCDKENLSLAQTGEQDDDDDQSLAQSPKQFGVQGDKEFEAAFASAKEFQKKYGSADQIPDSELPDTHDWRDINGYDFTAPFRDQGHCGSCYTISFTQVAEARMKVKYGKTPQMLSPQMLMTCNYMNEGCDGGWPHFNVFLGQSGHMISEECAPYMGKTRGDSCKNYESCPPIAKIKQSYLVGGGWGATSEKKMMKEILRNGPINGDFQAPSMFSVYKEGIFSEKGLVHLHQQKNAELLQLAQKSTLLETDADADAEGDNKPAEGDNKTAEPAKKTEKKPADKTTYSDTTLNDKGISWMDMNHSVVIVGWGKDDKTGTRYWIVRNSYGKNWGMNGDFLVKRGNNDFGMEVEQIAFEPIMCQEGQGSDCVDLQS